MFCFLSWWSTHLFILAGHNAWYTQVCQHNGTYTQKLPQKFANNYLNYWYLSTLPHQQILSKVYIICLLRKDAKKGQFKQLPIQQLDQKLSINFIASKASNKQ